MEVKKKFFIIEGQLINVEEMIKLENHHLQIIVLIINSGKKQQWMLKPMGESGMKKRVFHSLKVPPFPNTY